MTFQESITTCLKKYADFNGRASRSELWWFVLGAIIIDMVAAMIHPVLYGIAALGLFLPLLSAQARRMHDINKSGWLLLISLIPLVGLLVLYWLVQPTQEGSNQYGEAPTLSEI